MKIPAETDSLKDFQTPLRWSKVGLVVSLPLLGLLLYGSWQALIDPSFWSGSESEVLRELTLPPAQSLGEIREELKKNGCTLGDLLALPNPDLSVYPVFTPQKQMQQIRVYQAGGKKFRGKWHLVDVVEVSGLPQSTIEAPRKRYTPTSNQRGPDPILPFSELRPLGGNAPKAGIWFVAAGKSKSGAHGLIFHLAEKPQLRLHMVSDWVSPVGKLPVWEEAIAIPLKADQPDQPEVVIDQTISPEPYFTILRLVSTGEKVEPFQLRPIELQERGKIGKTYDQALTLARAGLWSPALALWKSADGKLSVPVREQHAYVAYHAKLTAQQAELQLTDPGERAKHLLVDGRYREALAIATSNETAARSILGMLKKNSEPLWRRIQATLQVNNNDAFATQWGSVVVLSRGGLPAARQWLYDRNRETSEYLATLDAMDVAPLTISPQQFLGTVTPLAETPGNEWYLPPGELPVGQVWYIIRPQVIRDKNIWKNSPINEFAERSPRTVWKALGMERNNILNIIETDRADNATFFNLAARSIAVDGEGNVQILATGSEYLAGGISQTRLPIVAVSGGGLGQVPSMPLQTMNPVIGARITQGVYRELEKKGQVSLDVASFQERLNSWKFFAVDINGDSSIEFVLQIQQDQIDLGDRYYPMVAVFDVQGQMIYSTIEEPTLRNWVTLLPSGTGGQILTELDGRYEIWDF